MKESVNHPNHYQSSSIEVIDVIEEFNLNFRLGNAIKYILRAGKKDPNRYIEDLSKSIWYINRELNKVGGANGKEQRKERAGAPKGSKPSTKKTSQVSTKTVRSPSKRNKKPKSKRVSR